jgi:hypothetical protein
MRFNIRFFVCGASLLLASVPGLASSYTFQAINYPGATATTPTSINNHGDIAGTYTDGSGSHGFLDEGGTFQTVSYNGQSIAPISINDSGQYVASLGNSKYLEYSGGAFSVITTSYGYVPGISPPAVVETVAGINDQGQIVEKVNPYSPDGDILIATGDTYVVVSGADDETFLKGFNNNDDVVAAYFLHNAEVYQGFVKLNGQSTVFFTGPDPSQSLTPAAINDSDQIVGDYGAQGFIYQNGAFAAFSYPGATATNLTGINDAGDLLGTYVNAGVSYAFLATPPNISGAPEPATFSLLPLGAILLIIGRRVRTHWQSAGTDVENP